MWLWARLLLRSQHALLSSVGPERLFLCRHRLRKLPAHRPMRVIVPALAVPALLVCTIAACGARTESGLVHTLQAPDGAAVADATLDTSSDAGLRCDAEIDCRWAPGTTCQSGQCCNGTVDSRGVCRCGEGAACDGLHLCCNAVDGGKLICGSLARMDCFIGCPSCPPPPH